MDFRAQANAKAAHGTVLGLGQHTLVFDNALCGPDEVGAVRVGAIDGRVRRGLRIDYPKRRGLPEQNPQDGAPKHRRR